MYRTYKILVLKQAFSFWIRYKNILLLTLMSVHCFNPQFSIVRVKQFIK
jgi:hypothetical protein